VGADEEDARDGGRIIRIPRMSNNMALFRRSMFLGTVSIFFSFNDILPPLEVRLKRKEIFP
jgi:hypothetical protein